MMLAAAICSFIGALALVLNFNRSKGKYPARVQMVSFVTGHALAFLSGVFLYKWVVS